MLTKKLNEGVATAIADSDLVTVCDAQGATKPISFENFMKAVRSGIRIGFGNLVNNTVYANSTEVGCVATRSIALNPNTSRITFGNNIPSEGNYSAFFYAKASNPCSVHVEINDCSTQSISVSTEWKPFEMSFHVTKFINLMGFMDVVVPSGSEILISDLVVTPGDIAPNCWAPSFNDLQNSWGGGNWLLRNQLRFKQERRCA